MTEEQAKSLVDSFEQWILATSRGSKLSLAERAIVMTFLLFFTTELGAKKPAPPAG